MKKKIPGVLFSLLMFSFLAFYASASFNNVAKKVENDSEQCGEDPLTNIDIGEFMDSEISFDYENKYSFIKEINYPGAFFIKVNFSTFNLRPGDYITVSNPEKTEEYTYYTDPTVDESDANSEYTVDSYGRFWSISITGDTAVVELHCSSEQSDNSFESDNEYGLAITRYTRGYPLAEIKEKNPAYKAICGQDDTRNAACYETSHPLIYKQAGAVAVLVRSSGSKFCTGWRIGPKNHMMTNNHCISSSSSVGSTEAWFGYQYKECNGGDLEPTTKIGGSELIVTNSNYDFTLFTLKDNSSLAQYGYLEADVRAPQLGEKIYILQHPQTKPTRVGLESDQNSGNECAVDSVSSSGVRYMCDTEPGSSGSAVLAMSTNKVISLHNTGGCTNGSNRMDKIWPYISDYIDSTPPQPDEEIQNGQTMNNLSASKDKWLYYKISLPEGVSDFTVQITGGSGDADLYTKHGARATDSDYDCRPYKNGNNETCEMKNPGSGFHYIGIKGYSNFSDLSLTASYSSGPDNELENGETIKDISASQNEWTDFTIKIPENSINLTITIADGSGDADLYTKFGSKPSKTDYDCRPYIGGNNEKCEISNPETGTYYISIFGYSGYSSLTLTVEYDTNN